jgi:hypothetical protein
MNPAQICLRLASHEDVPFLLELRRQTMHPHLLASGLIPLLEEDMRPPISARLFNFTGSRTG